MHTKKMTPLHVRITSIRRMAWYNLRRDPRDVMTAVLAMCGMSAKEVQLLRSVHDLGNYERHVGSHCIPPLRSYCWDAMCILEGRSLVLHYSVPLSHGRPNYGVACLYHNQTDGHDDKDGQYYNGTQPHNDEHGAHHAHGQQQQSQHRMDGGYVRQQQQHRRQVDGG